MKMIYFEMDSMKMIYPLHVINAYGRVFNDNSQRFIACKHFGVRRNITFDVRRDIFFQIISASRLVYVETDGRHCLAASVGYPSLLESALCWISFHGTQNTPPSSLPW